MSNFGFLFGIKKLICGAPLQGSWKIRQMNHYEKMSFMDFKVNDIIGIFDANLFKHKYFFT